MEFDEKSPATQRRDGLDWCSLYDLLQRKSSSAFVLADARALKKLQAAPQRPYLLPDLGRFICTHGGGQYSISN